MIEAVFSGVILGVCALIMFEIGTVQFRSQKPVSFYTGENAPDEKDITDVKAWNKKHGIMWIMYGVCIVSAWICGFIMGDSLLSLIPFFICLGLPIPLMVLYHHHLVKRYKNAR